MMAQLDGLLDFEPDFVLDQYEETRAYYLKSRQRPRRWSFGRWLMSTFDIYSNSFLDCMHPNTNVQTRENI